MGLLIPRSIRALLVQNAGYQTNGLEALEAVTFFLPRMQGFARRIVQDDLGCCGILQDL